MNDAETKGYHDAWLGAEAPERIWAVHDYVAGMKNILSGHIMLEPTEIAETTEYVRADLVEAKLAKAVEMLEREIRRVQKIQRDLPPPHKVGLIYVEAEYELMLAELRS